MVPVRQTISLICALALTGVAGYFFFDLLLYAPHAEGGMIALAGMATFVGLYWLWADFFQR